jgi:hypothetical protein
MNLADFENLSKEEKRRFLEGEGEVAITASSLNSNINPEGGSIIVDQRDSSNNVIVTTFFGGSLQLCLVIDLYNP